MLAVFWDLKGHITIDFCKKKVQLFTVICSAKRKEKNHFIYWMNLLYIYSHLPKDWFVVSKLFSGARHVGRLEAGIETHLTFTLDLVSDRSANKCTPSIQEL